MLKLVLAICKFFFVYRLQELKNKHINNMNTQQLLEKAKGILIIDGSMNWNFVPAIQGRRHPSLWRISFVVTNFAKLLFFNEEKEQAEKVLRDLTQYLVKRSEWYHKNSGRGYGPAEDYYNQWNTSSECCCPLQESISYVAASLGLESVRYYAVSLACPRSPQGYRPDPQNATITSITDEQHQVMVKNLSLLLEGGIDFFN